jgi:hypothetical protein
MRFGALGFDTSVLSDRVPSAAFRVHFTGRTQPDRAVLRAAGTIVVLDLEAVRGSFGWNRAMISVAE